LKKRNLILILSIAAFMALASFFVFMMSDPMASIEKARTLTFATIVSMILFVPFAFRSLKECILEVGLLTNKLLVIGVIGTLLLTLSVMYIPPFQRIFEFASLGLADWALPLSVAFAGLIFAEIIKAVTRDIK
jgi:Ca2+-transporting ATPase